MHYDRIKLNIFFNVHSHCFFIKTLKTLDLSLNKIGDTGVQYLADALRHNQVTLVIPSFQLYESLFLFTDTNYSRS